MKFPVSMLHDFVKTRLNAEQIGDLLTMAGFELEGIESVDGEDVLDIKVVSNRGDGLSMLGLARELLAKDNESQPTELYLRASERFSPTEHQFSIDISVATIESETCNRFAMRSFKGVQAGAVAPEWISSRLEKTGVRSISLLVDLTNYVMLELGQPLHAFDRDTLAEGRIVVRHAKPGEKLTTLNGIEHELSGQMMICDAVQPVGVPGVMGGLATEVTDATTEVLLESAHFTNTTVRKTRKELGLNTEASYRFERSVDPAGVVAAIERFTELLLQSQPDVQISDVIDHYPRPPIIDAVRLRVDRAARLLGMNVTPDQAISYLTRLGMDVQASEEELTVTPPTWRPDLRREEDLIEEIGRVHGYELIPEELPFGGTPLGGVHGSELAKDRLRDSLVRAGFVQIISHSLRSDHPLDEKCKRVAPRQPASPEHNVLRSSLLPGLAEAARRNGGRDLHLFEVGKVFFEREGFGETTYAAFLTQGALLTPNRQGEKIPSADFFSAKSALENVFVSLGIHDSVSFD